MPSNPKRRSFLLQSSAGLFGLPPLFAQSGAGNGPPPARDVLDFWVNQVGVPAEMVLGEPGSSVPSRAGFHSQDPGGGMQAAYGREPLFLHVDTEENRLVPAQEISPRKLIPSGDATVELRVERLRPNADDQSRFEKFSTGGIYLDVQQRAPVPELGTSLAWSMFSAIFPRTRKMAAPHIAPPHESAGVQTIALPDGQGSAMFSCFLKDPKRSAFGSFVNTFLELTGPKSPELLPLLGFPAIAAPALMAFRALVCNLQAHGGNHDWLFQNSPLDVTCTAEKASVSGSLRLRTGHYLVVPKAHASALKANLNDVKVVDGFLVPKSAGMLDVYDAAPETAKGASYLSVYVTVKKTRLNSCALPIPVR